MVNFVWTLRVIIFIRTQYSHNLITIHVNWFKYFIHVVLLRMVRTCKITREKCKDKINWTLLHCGGDDNKPSHVYVGAHTGIHVHNGNGSKYLWHNRHWTPKMVLTPIMIFFFFVYIISCVIINYYDKNIIIFEWKTPKAYLNKLVNLTWLS